MLVILAKIANHQSLLLTNISSYTYVPDSHSDFSTLVHSEVHYSLQSTVCSVTLMIIGSHKPDKRTYFKIDLFKVFY